MTEQHINDQELHDKILALFEYRLFPMLVRKDTVHFDVNFWNQLITLQKVIYHLDAHLEAHWETGNDKLNWHWNNITNQLMDFGIDEATVPNYLNHIKKYEKHELELRLGKSPLRLDMEYFYFYKSCDVKLLRRLIYEKYQLSSIFGSLADWRYYDLITEINDDVEDVFEDLEFINGNRFLISIHKYGKEKTEIDFLNFIAEIKEKARNKYESKASTKMTKIIYDLTLERIVETTDVMIKNLALITENQILTSNLFSHITNQKVF